MIFIILFGLAFLYWVSIPFRLILKHPLSVIRFGCIDFYHYIKYHLYDDAPSGKVRCYTAPFGGGKTLSAVHDIVSFYNRYDGRKIFDVSRMKWVVQKVVVVSNVAFTNIPYIPMYGLSQLVELQKYNQSIDQKEDTLTTSIFFIDESSSQCNSRQFSKNFSPVVLGALLSCRHFRTNLYMTSQEFNMTDKLMREVCQEVIDCHKIWRFVIHSHYNASVLEYAPDPTIIKPIFRSGFFVRNEYNDYDTLAMVSELSHSASSGDILSESEVLNNRNVQLSDIPDSRKKKQFRKRKK